jgi:hypothetical protein
VANHLNLLIFCNQSAICIPRSIASSSTAKKPDLRLSPGKQAAGLYGAMTTRAPRRSHLKKDTTQYSVASPGWIAGTSRPKKAREVYSNVACHANIHSTSAEGKNHIKQYVI